MEVRKLSDAVTPEKVGEPEIIARILRGKEELYEILIRRNNQKLYRVVRSYLRDPAEVQDIMQDTYLKAYEKLFQFRNASSFTTWLVRIGINETLARLREKGKIYQFNGKEQGLKSKAILELPDNDQLNPEKKIIRNEARQLLENAIDKLDIKYRAVYVLREMEGMSTREVAECLGISDSNVKVRHHRARNMLKENLYELSVGNSVFDFGSSSCDLLTERVMGLLE